MTATYTIAALVAVLVTILHVTLAQQQPQQLGPCSQGLDGELPTRCLESNGINYNGTLFIISGNRTGALPPGVTYDSFRGTMCNVAKQDQVVPCILQLMQTWNKTECTEQDRILMSARGGQLLALMEGFCGDPCEQAAMQTMIQCFAAVQVDPSPILNQNATIITSKFAFVGNDSTSAASFCNSRQRLFSCLSPLGTQCPKIVERLYTLGLDLQGLELATQVQCQNIDGYLTARTCLSKPAPAPIVACKTKAETDFRAVQDGRYRTGLIRPSLYQANLCGVQLLQVKCQVSEFASACGDAVSKQLSAFECTSLPAPCRTLPDFSSLCDAVTTPSPTITVRPTPPPITIGGGGGGNTNTGRGTGSSTGSGGNGGAGGDGGVGAVVCSSALVVIMAVLAML